MEYNYSILVTFNYLPKGMFRNMCNMQSLFIMDSKLPNQRLSYTKQVGAYSLGPVRPKTLLALDCH